MENDRNTYLLCTTHMFTPCAENGNQVLLGTAATGSADLCGESSLCLLRKGLKRLGQEIPTV